MSDVSIIIQGPLNEISLKNIPTYKKYGKVIVSCWNGYDKKLLKYIDDDVLLVRNDLMKVEHYNRHNIYYQAFTTHAGLEKSETKFSIKVRSDESYSSLDVFVKALNENPKCVITGDIYFFGEDAKFHISDHVIGGKTKNLLGAFGIAKDICETTPSNVGLSIRASAEWLQPASPEALIMLSFLQQINAINNILLFSTLYATVAPSTVTVDSCDILRIIAGYDIAQCSVELIKNHARIVSTACMGDVFLNTRDQAPLIHGRLIKSGSEELLCTRAYGETFSDIEVRDINK